ncbi:MAG: transcriptional repressor NrdR [Clostridia bacterium]|nr:transcriptional repressor NrdR [Clostridia bacterium]MBQ9848713.1 transcriptional repressor NrdR [Clostridia bacterium]
MKCPLCGHAESKVIDSRPAADGSSIRRRRECLECQKRFTTYENIETLPLIVIKKDLSRETFDRNKILNSIIRACDKRQVTLSQMNSAVTEIENALQNTLQNEITSERIGEMVMDKLKDLDEVAYIRFASVYRQFKDLGAFMDELKKMLAEK